MSGPNALLLELVESTVKTVCEMRGEADDLSLDLRDKLSATKLAFRSAATPASEAGGSAVVRDAAHTVPGLSSSPFAALIDNSIEQLAEEYPDLIGDDLESVALIRSAIERGIEIANTRLGDLA